MPEGSIWISNQRISSRGVCPLLADTPKCAMNVAFGGKADMPFALHMSALTQPLHNWASHAGDACAHGIAGAKLVPLESRNHIVQAHEPAHRVMSDAIADFLGTSVCVGRCPARRRFTSG